MKTVIGIDIGGTKITGILFDGKKIKKELTVTTPKNLSEFKRNLIKIADFLSAGAKIYAVGVGMAGAVDTKSGVVRHSPNIKYARDLSLVKFFHLNGFKTVRIDNDANCFTRAELLLGQGKKFQNFLALTLGTGIGGGIVINRRIYRGKNNFGAEFGHIVMGDVFLEKLFQSSRDKGDFRQAGKLIGKGLVSFINIFAPDAIIIGGGFGHNESRKYLPAAKSEIRKYLFNEKAKTVILITKLKNAGALGAALLFSKNQ
ncbi:MAG: ROK family protein [Candidatus Wolfebacteria bacterium]|nr:ROK family protein [Candidatus Wolfebacteria bacterium]